MWLVPSEAHSEKPYLASIEVRRLFLKFKLSSSPAQRPRSSGLIFLIMLYPMFKCESPTQWAIACLGKASSLFPDMLRAFKETQAFSKTSCGSSVILLLLRNKYFKFFKSPNVGETSVRRFPSRSINSTTCSSPEKPCTSIDEILAKINSFSFLQNQVIST